LRVSGVGWEVMHGVFVTVFIPEDMIGDASRRCLTAMITGAVRYIVRSVAIICRAILQNSLIG
jgi:hypothetical protein